MADWQDVLAHRLQQQRDQNLERHLTAFETMDTTRIRAPESNQTLLNFSGNDYLGLRTHPALLEAIAKQADVAGAGAARLISGNHPLHEQLEQALADFFQRDAALLFSTGYVANVAVVQALARRGDHIVQDRLCHASLVDGARLADGKLQRYRHLDYQHAEELLEPLDGLKLLVSDGVFSMDGDLAPVAELSQVAARHNTLLIIDDAHSIGVLGDSGGGLLQQAGLSQSDVPVLIGTFGKALGLAGAFVTGSQQLIDYLRNFARGWIYSTAPPLPLVAAQLAALQLLKTESQRRHQLHQNIAHFKLLAAQANLQLLPSDTPIQPLMIGESEPALQVQAKLRDQGFYVAAIRPPTVPAGSSRLRLTLCSEHQPDDIEALITALTIAIQT